MVSKCILDTLRIKPKPWEMSKGQAWQERRVQHDEQRRADLKYVHDDRKDMYRACWNEALEESSDARRLRYIQRDMKTEVTLCNQTLIEVRRAQLAKMLKLEDEKYRDELNSMGMTIFKERL